MWVWPILLLTCTWCTWCFIGWKKEGLCSWCSHSVHVVSIVVNQTLTFVGSHLISFTIGRTSLAGSVFTGTILTSSTSCVKALCSNKPHETEDSDLPIHSVCLSSYPSLHWHTGFWEPHVPSLPHVTLELPETTAFSTQLISIFAEPDTGAGASG